jgi:hypothetical protein
VGGFGGNPVPLGAPQHTIPHGDGSEPSAIVKSGVMPPVAVVLVAMIQRTPVPWLATLLDTSSAMPLNVPSHFQLERRLCATELWNPVSIRISTKSSPSPPARSSSMFDRWNAARAGGAADTTTSDTSNDTMRSMTNSSCGRFRGADRSRVAGRL